MINYLKFAAVFGVPFGLLTGGMRALANHDNAFLHGVFQGLFFGSFMAAWTVWWTRRNRLRLESNGISGADMRPRQQRQVQLADSPAMAFAACVRALQQIPKARITGSDPGNGTLTAQIGMSWRSFGERVVVTVVPAGSGSKVTIASKPVVRTTLIDGGKGTENVERVRKALTAA